MLLEVLVAGEDALLVSVVEAEPTDEAAVETVVAIGELTADVHGDKDVGLRLLSLLGVASMRSSAVTGFPPALVGLVETEVAEPPPLVPFPEDSTRSLLQLFWSCTLGDVEETSVRPFVDESGGELVLSPAAGIMPPAGFIMPPMLIPPGNMGDFKSPRLMLVELLLLS